jgi:NDP-sugar pyrophosphorylase family protein
MREKPVISHLTNTGIYIVEPEVIDDIGDDEAIGFPDVVARAMARGCNVAAFPIGESEWMDMGQPNELERMRKRLYGKD